MPNVPYNIPVKQSKLIKDVMKVMKDIGSRMVAIVYGRNVYQDSDGLVKAARRIKAGEIILLSIPETEQVKRQSK